MAKNFQSRVASKETKLLPSGSRTAKTIKDVTNERKQNNNIQHLDASSGSDEPPRASQQDRQEANRNEYPRTSADSGNDNTNETGNVLVSVSNGDVKQRERLFNNLRDIRCLDVKRDETALALRAGKISVIETLFTIDMVIFVTFMPIVFIMLVVPNVLLFLLAMPYILLVIPYVVAAMIVGTKMSALFGSAVWNNISKNMR